MAGHIASSGNVCWETPDNVLGELGQFDLDPCASKTSRVARVNWALERGEDGLNRAWAGRVFVNPPYGRYWWDKRGRCHPGAPGKSAVGKGSILRWVEKCAQSAAGGCTVIALLPAVTDTRHWQETIFQTARAVCFIRGRLRFKGAPGPAPMATALVYWGGEPGRFAERVILLGQVIALRGGQ